MFQQISFFATIFSHDAKAMQWWNIGFILCVRSLRRAIKIYWLYLVKNKKTEIYYDQDQIYQIHRFYTRQNLRIFFFILQKRMFKRCYLLKTVSVRISIQALLKFLICWLVLVWNPNPCNKGYGRITKLSGDWHQATPMSRSMDSEAKNRRRIKNLALEMFKCRTVETEVLHLRLSDCRYWPLVFNLSLSSCSDNGT